MKLPPLDDLLADPKAISRFLNVLERRPIATLTEPALDEIATHLAEAASGKVIAAAGAREAAEAGKSVADYRSFLEAARGLRAAERIVRSIAKQKGQA